MTDAAGKAQFTTIYPGYYAGRTVHIHFKVRTEQSGRTFDFTSQLFFDDTFSDQVFTRAPYNAKGPRGTRNANDGIYRNGGDQLLLDVKPSGSGYAVTFGIGLQV
jgi:protocatechuate 3,4-dioxygenase beta subunit